MRFIGPLLLIDFCSENDLCGDLLDLLGPLSVALDDFALRRDYDCDRDRTVELARSSYKQVHSRHAVRSGAEYNGSVDTSTVSTSQ